MNIFSVSATKHKAVRMLISWGFILSTLQVIAQKSGPNPQLSDPRLEARVEGLLKQMTLSEKIGQLVQYDPGPDAAGMVAAAAINPALDLTGSNGHFVDAMKLAETGQLGSLLNAIGAARTNSYQHAAVDKSRLHIPLIFGADVIHGFRTTFPIPLGLAASFDPPLIEAVAHTAGNEASTAGLRWVFSPMVDITRDARWGRAAEGAGEDAYLGSAIARAYVRGYQGGDLSQPGNVAVSVKHFAAYGAAEAGREYNTTDMSEVTLREVYLPPYKAAVEAGATTMMSSFNALNGVPATANPYLLTQILRREWGFQGFVLSDYNAVMELTHHGIALTPEEATRKAILSGLDMDMMSHFFDANLPQLVASGAVPVSVVDEAVKRVLRVKFALGLFERPYTSEATEVTRAVSAQRPLARKAAEESLVLLKNDNPAGSTGSVLPVLLKHSLRVALVGPLGDSASEMSGPWAIFSNPGDNITVRQAINEKLQGVSGSLVFAKGTEIETESQAGFAEAIEAARRADVVVLALGESSSMSGEAAARSKLDLPGNQQQLLQQVLQGPICIPLTWRQTHSATSTLSPLERSTKRRLQ
jgi:beta-glucosidase